MWVIPALIGVGLVVGRVAITGANWIATIRSQVSPKATTTPALLFTDSDNAALDILTQGGEPSLRIEQTDNEGLLTLTVKRKRGTP